MRMLPIGAILLSGLFVVPFQTAFAQTEVAHANEAAPNCIIFFSKGPAYLTTVAEETIQMAAADANRSSSLVRVVGPIEYAAAVKDEMVRDGVPTPSILVVPRSANAVPAIGDGVGEPASVKIHY